MEKIYENFLTALSHKEPPQVPVSIWNTRCNLGMKKGQKLIDYYRDHELKAAAQLSPLELLGDVVLIPGLWPDYGIALESSAFGCPVHYSDDNPPQPTARFSKLEEISELKALNPLTDGLMPQALQEYKGMLKQLSREKLQKLPYLDGCSLTTGPLEVSAMLVGHTEFFYGLYDSPELIHKLLDIVSEGIIRWLKELEKISGEIKMLTMIEHIPGQISAQFCKEYAQPYIARVFNSFPGAVKVYHNEDNLMHIVDMIPKLGADIFHFGEMDLPKTKELIGDKITLKGNIHPLRVLLEGSVADVYTAADECLKAAVRGGGYLLSSGGGFAPGTPLENIRAMVDAVRR